MTNSFLCCVFNVPSIYRIPIFSTFDKELNCDFYFGDKVLSKDKIKTFDPQILNGFKDYCPNIAIFKNIYIQKGLLGLLYKNYNTYVVTGSIYCLNLWLFLFLAKFLDKRVFLWTHGWYGKEKGLNAGLKLIFLRLSSGLFLYGNRAKNLLIEKGINPNKLHVVYNSLDYKAQMNIFETLTKSRIYEDIFNNKNKTLVFLGRLTKEKKIDLLIEAVQMLKDQHLYVNLIIIGDGSEIDNLKKKTAELSLTNNILFYGESYSEVENANFLYNSDLAISPGNVGLFAIHSLSFGTPIITHNNFTNQMPEFEAIIPDVSGNFFYENDVISLTNTIKSWLTNGVDRQIVRERCLSVIKEKYNPDYQISIFKNVINA